MPRGVPRALVDLSAPEPMLGKSMEHDERTCAGGAGVAAQAAHAPIRGDGWSVEPLGRGVFLFRWERGHDDIVLPASLVGDGAVIEHGAHRIEVSYFGPNHSGSNLIFTFDTGRGRMLTWVDGVEPGIAPYRNLPDTDFGGYLHSLEQAARLRFDSVIGGHAGPGEPRWVADYHEYLQRLVEATAAAYQSMGGQAPLPGEDGIAMTERVRHEAGVRAASALRARFGHWSGFDPWAPQTADRILSFLITGN
jgi:hypothetical protein